MKQTILPLLRSRQLLFSLGVLLLCSAQQGFTATTKDYIDTDKGRDAAPSGKGWGERHDANSSELANSARNGKPVSNYLSRSKSSGTGISYHGGPVLTSPVTIYYIWYGDWTNNTSAQTILTNFASSIGGSPYFNINTTYTSSAGRVQNTTASPKLSATAVQVTGAPLANGQANYYPYGASLSDANIQTIVAGTISSGAFGSTTPDINGVYFVLTSGDVKETSGFLTQYCGWHTHASISGVDTKFSFVGNPAANLSACAAQTSSPNGNAPADAMVSVIAHELEEVVTDPDLNAWYDTRGYENADKCAWNFGTTTTVNPSTTSSYKYNITLGNYKYLIQQNWVNSGSGGCKMSY